MTVIRRRDLEVGELVEVHPNIDPNSDFNRMRGLAIVINANPPEGNGLVEVRYVKPRGLPEEKLPQQRLVGGHACVRI
tara:strand:+ start:820 stop:1053 length:234 start_codon:yes stop_codon:yes gene_type:complete